MKIDRFYLIGTLFIVGLLGSVIALCANSRVEYTKVEDGCVVQYERIGLEWDADEVERVCP